MAAKRTAIALAALLLTVAASRESSAGAAAAAGRATVGITADEAVEAVAGLPEVKAWGKYIIESSGDKVHGALMVSREHPEKRGGRKYWSVGYYEDQPTHLHRWQTFLVRLDGREILVDDVVSGDYVSLREWRRTQKPMERIRPDPRSPEAFLRSLYDYHQPWVRRLATSEEALPQFFEESLVALFRSADECSVRNQDMSELDFDPILSGQDFGEHGISTPVFRAVPSESGTSYEATFRLFPDISKIETTVSYELVETPKGWRVHDISWGKRYRTLRQLLAATCE